jgi:hypothetical protein
VGDRDALAFLNAACRIATKPGPSISAIETAGLDEPRASKRCPTARFRPISSVRAPPSPQSLSQLAASRCAIALATK